MFQKVKVKQSIYRPGGAQRGPDGPRGFQEIKVEQSRYRPRGARRGPEGSRKLSFQDFVTTAQDGGKVVSLTHRPPLPQEMLLVLISVIG